MNENPKNYDPRMHSAEHILNQTMVRMFNCGRAFNAHIEKKKSKCDYRLDRNLSESEIAEIESRVNQVIEMKLDVSESFINRSEGEKLFNLSRLPDEAGDSLRIISIGNYDACPCSGVHISNTEEIGKFKIISSSCDNGFLRIRFKLDPCSN
jgi:Ser-tRNA(Ala) deacylase AlaX